MFPGELVFSQHDNRLVFDTAYLQRPLVRTADELDAFIRNAPADVMTIPGYDSTLEGQIERLLKTRNSYSLNFPSIHELAKELGLSVQTLHRQLQRSGSSYQKIKDDLRRSTALNLLADKQWSIEDISERVGFSEARSFSRAFKQWTGMSPRQYRKTTSQSV